MKTLELLLLVLISTFAHGDEWTLLVATEGAMVTIEKSSIPAPAPAPKPSPDGAGMKAGGPIDTYRDAKALIDKGNALADRGKAILDQAQRDGKITVDIRLPTPPVSKPQTQSATGGLCPGGVCPVQLPAEEGTLPRTAAADSAAPCSGGVYQPRRFWRWRR